MMVSDDLKGLFQPILFYLFYSIMSFLCDLLIVEINVSSNLGSSVIPKNLLAHPSKGCLKSNGYSLKNAEK